MTRGSAIALATLALHLSFGAHAIEAQGTSKTTTSGSQGTGSAKGTGTSSKKPSTKKPSTKKPTKKPAKKSEKESAAPVPKHSYTADTISVGSALASRGERALGSITLASGTGGTVDVPVAVIHGAKAGPIVAYLSQAPDTSYSTVAGLNKLINLIDPAKVSGSIVILPAFDAAVGPAVVEKIVSRADIIVALSGREIADEFHPYGYWTRTGNAAQDKATRALAMAFGLDVVAVRDLDVTSANARGELLGAALAQGKSALLVEGGHATAAAASATNSIVAGCMNVLGSIGVITRAVGMDGKVSWIGVSQDVRAESNGVFSADIERGAKVRKGEKLGTYTDSATATSSDVIAPRDGIVTFLRGTPTVASGATIVTIAVNHGATPPPFTKPKP